MSSVISSSFLSSPLSASYSQFHSSSSPLALWALQTEEHISAEKPVHIPVASACFPEKLTCKKHDSHDYSKDMR